MLSTGKIKRVISSNANEQGDEKVQKLNANDGGMDNIMTSMNTTTTSNTKNEDWKVSDLPSDQTMGLKNLAINSPITSDKMTPPLQQDKEMINPSSNNNNNKTTIASTTTESGATVAPSNVAEVNLVKALSSNNCSNASSSLSVNTTSSSPNLNAKEKEETTIVPTMLRRTVSDVSSNSSSETRTTVQSVSGNWGWFEDVHGHDHPGSSDLNTKKDSDETRDTNRKTTDSKRSKKKGLLQFNTLEKPLDDYVKSSQQSKYRHYHSSTHSHSLYNQSCGSCPLFFGFSLPLYGMECSEEMTGAVTAPIYVLEESPSTQKLWKDTAGNRPPQPVEERAFFEKMWAQNFVKSQVIYQMPVEVLTATSPISLSPFADGNFPEDTRGVSNDDPTEYSSYPKKSNDDSENGNSSHVSAEATIVYRMNNNAGYYGPSRSNNLKSLGPHHHHHTLVNKRVLCDEDGELVVVVRGDNVFGTTVSKSFALQGDFPGADTVSISIASYRVVEVRFKTFFTNSQKRISM